MWDIWPSGQEGRSEDENQNLPIKADISFGEIWGERVPRKRTMKAL